MTKQEKAILSLFTDDLEPFYEFCEREQAELFWKERLKYFKSNDVRENIND